MTFNKAIFKGTVVSSILLTSVAAFATPAQPPSVPEPTSVVSMALGAIAIFGMVVWNRAKMRKSTSSN